MLEYLHLKYYRSYVDARFDLSKGTTAFVGMSMSGKTVIERALKLLRTYRPTGFSYKHRFADEPCIVEAGIDGYIIRLTKHTKALDEEGNKAIFYLKRPDGSEKIFTNFGVDVPEEIQTIINITDISIQGQLDAYFLVASTGGEIAKTINKITGLDIGDDWTKKIQKRYDELSIQEKVLSGEIAFSEDDIKFYDGIDEAGKLCEKASIAIADSKNAAARISEANDILLSLQGSIEQINRVQEFINILEPAEQLIIDFKGIKDKREEIDRKIDFLLGYVKYQLANDEINRYIKTIKNIKSHLEDIYKIFTEKRQSKQILQNYITNFNCSATSAVFIEEKKDLIVEKVMALGECFTCGGDTNDPERIRANL
jgi:DNA repair exonuclease SbcCD ATPase subunit